MTIDFSKGIDYWIDLIQRLLTAFADFVSSVFGIEIFAPGGDEGAVEEETTGE